MESGHSTGEESDLSHAKRLVRNFKLYALLFTREVVITRVTVHKIHRRSLTLALRNIVSSVILEN